MPTPRLLTAFNQTPTPVGAPQVGDTQDQITDEVVEGAAPGFQYVIRGLATPTRVPLALQVGDVVSVKWQRGTPFMILNLQSRKGPGHDVISGGQLVEVLYIADDGTGTKDIWFRSATVLANLKLRGDWGGADPDQVKWGAREDSFFVRCGNDYYAYKFSRASLDRAMTAAPKPKLLRPKENPWTNETVMLTVTYAASITVDTPCVSSVENITQDHLPPQDITYDETSTVMSPLSRGASDTKTTQVKLTKTVFDAGSVVVFDAELDFQYSLVLTVQARMGGLVNQPGTTVLNVDFKPYGRIEQPVGTIISEDGDITATGPQCILEPTPDGPDGQDDPIPWQAPAADDDWHVVIVNVTKATVVYRTTLESAAISSDIETVISVGAADLINNTESLWPTPDDRLLVNASQGSAPGFLPNNDTPIGGADPMAVYDAISLQTHSIGNKQVWDAAAVTWLRLPVGVERASFSSSIVKYAHLKYGNRGVVVNDPTLLNSVYLSSTTHDSHDARQSQILLYPVKFNPHRTKAGGDLFVFAICEKFIDGIFTGQLSSFWRYTTDTGKAIAIQDWAVEDSGLNFFAVDILGASLKHVLYIIRRGHTTQNWRTFLADHAVGTSKLLFDETAANFSTVPPNTAAFIARNWEVARPDVMYLLDDADRKVTNDFLLAWNGRSVTFDPAKLVVNARLKPFGTLKKLQRMTPVAAPTAGNPPHFPPLSLHVLNPHSSPAFIRDL